MRRHAVKSVRKGLYQIELAGIGLCARVHPGAGDAGPYLEREAYDLLGFAPRFDALRKAGPADYEQLPIMWRCADGSHALKM